MVDLVDLEDRLVWNIGAIGNKLYKILDQQSPYPKTSRMGEPFSSSKRNIYDNYTRKILGDCNKVIHLPRLNDCALMLCVIGHLCFNVT